ncbi:MAG: ATP-binding protein [Bacteroidota bacterium]|jgi:two-component system NtrC family sensor kinase|nr:ATP-binding protein [Bacteroidota bacterium]
MRLYHTLSFKLIASLFLALMVVSIGVVYVRVTAQNAVMEETIHVCAERASSFAKIALHQGMQENHPEVIQQTISQIGNASDIERISLYDKNGRIAYSSDSLHIGRVVQTEDEACAPCHGGRTDFTRTQSKEFVRIYNSPSGNRVLGLITPITNLPSCSDGPCHVHPPEQTVLGVLDVQMSLARMDAQAETLQTSVIVSILLTFIILAAGAGVFIYFFVHKPVQSVIAGTHRIATGDLGYKIPLKRKDELGLLVKSFNRMASELKRSEAELVEWSNTLEEKVEKKTEELNKVQVQIMHMEKMASLGKLSSVIAHELNNPLAGILTYARLVEKRLGRADLTPAHCETMQKDVRLIAEESRRCGDIVKNLLFFARSREGEYRQADLNEVIEKTIRLVHHKIDLYDIRLEVHVPPETVLATCDQNQIQQAVLALIINAIEAMPDGGRLTVGLHRDDGNAQIRISDTGIGISEEDQRRVFEPFFTTKEEGHGTGLGLSVAYGIVQSHDGHIRVESTMGKGSTFIVTLPISGPSTYFQEQA